jgi:nucleosome-remodeling factor subunit BPTF
LHKDNTEVDDGNSEIKSDLNGDHLMEATISDNLPKPDKSTVIKGIAQEMAPSNSCTATVNCKIEPTTKVSSMSDTVKPARPVSPSLCLQKYTNKDGQITLTAAFIEELEAKLAVFDKTCYKVTLGKRSGPGRPPTKVTGAAVVNGSSSGQKKLPPVQHFRSSHAGQKSLFAIDRQILRSLARREGKRECPGFNYSCKMNNVGWPYPCPRPYFCTAWRYRTQTLRSISAAAIQLRILWACIRWDDLNARPPASGTSTLTTETDITTTELLQKRDVPPLDLRSEYLVRTIVVPISVQTNQHRGKSMNYINQYLKITLH